MNQQGVTIRLVSDQLDQEGVEALSRELALEICAIPGVVVDPAPKAVAG